MNQTISLTQEEFELLRKLIEENSGISLGDAKGYLVESRLQPLLKESGCTTFKEFYLKSLDRRNGLIDKIIDAMTTHETLWFRDVTPFITLREKVLPELLKTAQRRKVRIWSAGCSTGQEPYSIAITVHEYAITHPGLTPSRFEILATDISYSALFTAIAGRYHGLGISRGMNQDTLGKYFIKNNYFYDIKNEIKSMVTFKQMNLQAPFTLLGHFDIIFCRNVIIYFSERFKKELFVRFYQSLQPRGFLFLGYSENLGGLSGDFEPIQYKKALFYRAKERKMGP